MRAVQNVAPQVHNIPPVVRHPLSTASNHSGRYPQRCAVRNISGSRHHQGFEFVETQCVRREQCYEHTHPTHSHCSQNCSWCFRDHPITSWRHDRIRRKCLFCPMSARTQDHNTPMRHYYNITRHNYTKAQNGILFLLRTFSTLKLYKA